MSWSTVPFEELYAEPSRNGVYKSKEYQGTGISVVKMKEVFDNRRIHGGDFDLDRFQLSSEELLRFHLSINDLLFARTSVVPEGVGKCSLICSLEGDLAFESNLIRVRLDESRANPAYLFYYFQSPFGRGRILAISNGAAVRTIRGSDLKNVKIELPGRETQNRIASILSAYDDLIENNRRRIQLLEQAARLLYREWFVHLRFPGHEHVAITDGVPVGWDKKPFSELATFLNGFAFKPAHLGDVGLPIVKIPELRDGPTAKTPRNTGEHIPEKYLLENGDILFSWSGTLLVNIWNHGKGLLNQHLFKVTPVSANLRGLVYFALKQALVEFQNQTTGSTMKHIRKGALEKVAPIIPNAVLLDEFEATVAPMLEQISVLQRQTTEAVKARDLLLPRLMNGEVAV